MSWQTDGERVGKWTGRKVEKTKTKKTWRKSDIGNLREKILLVKPGLTAGMGHKAVLGNPLSFVALCNYSRIVLCNGEIWGSSWNRVPSWGNSKKIVVIMHGGGASWESLRICVANKKWCSLHLLSGFLVLTYHDGRKVRWRYRNA